MVTPDLRSFQADTAEQSLIDFPGPKVGQFKATNNCNSQLYLVNIYQLDLTQTKFMNGATLGLPVLSPTKGNLYSTISHIHEHALDFWSISVLALLFKNLKTLFEDYAPIKYISLW